MNVKEEKARRRKKGFSDNFQKKNEKMKKKTTPKGPRPPHRRLRRGAAPGRHCRRRSSVSEPFFLYQRRRRFFSVVESGNGGHLFLFPFSSFFLLGARGPLLGPRRQRGPAPACCPGLEGVRPLALRRDPGARGLRRRLRDRPQADPARGKRERVRFFSLFLERR